MTSADGSTAWTGDDHEAERVLDWDTWSKARADAGWCPYSGLTIVGCKRTDICDCFDFPERDVPDGEMSS